MDIESNDSLFIMQVENRRSWQNMCCEFSCVGI